MENKMYEQLMQWLFWTGIAIIHWVEPILNMTYVEVNVWAFIIIHPMITLLFIILWLRERFVR